MTKSLIAEFTVTEGNEPRVREMMAELAVQVRREPGNVAFVPYTREDDPRHYVVYEVYADDEAFRQHITSEHSTRFNAELRGLIEGDGSELTWLRGAE